MKRLLILLAVTSLSFSMSAWADCNSCQASSPCGGSGYSSCDCTEPSCGSNSCLDSETCCRVFGNIGASDFTHYWEDDTLDEPRPFTTGYNDAYTYPRQPAYKGGW